MKNLIDMLKLIALTASQTERCWWGFSQ